MAQRDSSLDFPKLAGYVLGAGFFVWLGGGGWVPLLVSGVSLLSLRRVLKELR